MKRLFGNEFAPVTFSCGFIEAPFDRYCETFLAWWNQIAIEFRTTALRESLQTALPQLEPLQTPQNRYLIFETESPWTAIFSNGLKTSDVTGPVGHLCRVLKCQGLEVSCIPDRSYAEDKKDAIRIYGSVSFTLYGPEPTDWLNRVRTIAAMNDGGKWVFVSEGATQPYETTKAYQNRRIAERFTCEMLVSYCAALGVKFLEPSFYGESGLLVNQLTEFPKISPRMSISEAQSHLYLAPES